MAGYVHAHKLQRTRVDLSFLAAGLHLPWVSLAFLTGFVIEAMLAGRLWLQMTEANATGLQRVLISITDVLVAPFSRGESAGLANRANGVFEYSTLIAVEAYLIATLAVVLVIVAMRFLVFGTTTAVGLKRRHDIRRRTRLIARRGTKIEPATPESGPAPIEAGLAPAPVANPAVAAISLDEEVVQ
jgi:hypothetical protein